MPPKAKFTKEEVIETALKIVQKEGFETLTARALGGELGSSPRPIFTVFNSMEEVQNEVVAAAKALYFKYQEKGLKEKPAFKGSGMEYIKFAAEQPKLFQLLFMKQAESVPATGDVLMLLDEHYGQILKSVQDEYGFGYQTAKELYLHLWVYSHGIAALIATNVCKFTENEISAMLSEVCVALIKKFKSEGKI